MPTAELLAALARERPNGVSFEPMALRLIRQKVSFEDCQIDDLKSAMFQIGDERWFSSEMILDVGALFALEKQATEWLEEYGCFSIERLFENFHSVIRHLATPEAWVAFLRYLKFHVAAWKTVGNLCAQPTLDLDEAMAAISEMTAEWVEEANGILPLHEIEQVLPHLTAEMVEGIRLHFLPEIHITEISGIPCWCSTEAFTLPNDFSEKLTSIVDTLYALKENITITKLEFALNLFYRTRFREENALLDNNTFIRICAKHYQGEKNFFPKAKQPPHPTKINLSSALIKRARSQNTRFSNLGVTVGAALVFTRDKTITCTVLDGSNQVEYDGNTYAISTLANHLLDMSASNGFRFFSYEGETLCERRLRLEREGKQEEHLIAEQLPSGEVREAEDGIIGLSGQVIAASTWQAFKRDGTNPRVAEWTRRVENGESVENIAHESGLTVLTVKEYINNRRRYYDVCQKNGIVPEGNMNV